MMPETNFGPLVYAERPWRRDPQDTVRDGDIYSASPDARAETVRAAYEAGIRLFHAAHEREAASLGASLRTLGMRNQIFLSTTDGDALDRCPDTEAGGAEAITRAIARKQELMGVERLDLFLLYDFRPETCTPARLAGAWQALEAARMSGTVRQIGATCYSAYDTLADALEAGLALDVVLARFNFYDQGAAARLLSQCQAREIAALAAQTFSWVGGVPFVRFPNTWRYRNLTKNFYGFTAGQAHLHWVLSQPNIQGVIVSMQTPEQVAENEVATKIDKVPTGLESLFESFAEAITRTREGWRGLLQDEQWEIRAAAEAYLPGKTQ